MHITAAQIQDCIAGKHLARLVHTHAAVRVPIIGKTGIKTVFHHKFLQFFNVGRTTVRIDIRPVRLAAHHKCFCPQRVKNPLRHSGCRTVRKVKSDLLIAEGTRRQGNQVADIAVPPDRIIHCAADLLPNRIRQFPRLPIQIRLNLLLDCRLKLVALPVYHLNPVIIIRIMACRNHNAAIKILAAHHVGNTWCRGHMEQIYVRPARGKTRRERVLKHIAGAAGILANHHLCLMLLPVIPSQKPAHLKRLLHFKIYISLSPKTIRPKIFAHRSCHAIRHAPFPNFAGSRHIFILSCNHHVFLPDKQTPV